LIPAREGSNPSTPAIETCKMISFFYRLKLFSYILRGLKNVTVKLLLLTIYTYVSSIILIFLSNGFWYVLEFSSPSSAFYELYKFFKSCYDNIDDLEYSVSFRVLVAFFAPHFLYKLLLNIDWKHLLIKIAIWTIELFKKKKASGFSVSSNSNENKHSNSTLYGNNDTQLTIEEATEKVNIIKKLLIKDIEQTIDKRLNDIFFHKKNKSH
jgi:hypothetical protein